jgi:uncharacterized DUF497 family protein
MRRHERFEWDAGKARKNLAKHGVSFEDARIVLRDMWADQFHLEEYDDDHSEMEDRWKTTASDPQDRGLVLVIIWTQRQDIQHGSLTRIISARHATPTEKKRYEYEIHTQ